MKKLTLGSLFAGIGGIDLGFERAGFETAWQVEINPYCRKVLAKHFPNAERFEDVRECGAHNLKPVDVVAGGFPCQDISNAGKRAGIDGERSGLWSEYARIIGEIRPRFVLIENVAALLGRGMVRVLCDLTALGYDAEWEVISAADVGAPHLRERVWIVAYPDSAGRERKGQAQPEGWNRNTLPSRESKALAYASSSNRNGGSGDVQMGRLGLAREVANYGDSGRAKWSPEPSMGRVAHGVSNRLDKLRALGNAVVPQIPELIARRIAEVA